MIIEEVVNSKLNKKNILKSFKLLLFDDQFGKDQISQVKKCLPKIEGNIDPYSVCNYRIKKI